MIIPSIQKMPFQERLWKGLSALFVLQLSIMGAQADPATMASTNSTGAKFKVAKTLVKLFSSHEEIIKDLTAEDEAELEFDQFDENSSCKVWEGVSLQEYKTVIDLFVQQHSIPEDVKIPPLNREFPEHTNFPFTVFKFAKGKTGRFTHDSVASVKLHDGKMDVTYSVYFLEFKLSPKVIEHKESNQFLGFTIGTKVWRETKERNLSLKDQDYMKSYFMKKAIEGSKEQCSSLVEAQHCTAENSCE